MNGKHYLAFGVGVAVGYLVLPYLLSMVSNLFSKKA